MGRGREIGADAGDVVGRQRQALRALGELGLDGLPLGIGHAAQHQVGGVEARDGAVEIAEDPHRPAPGLVNGVLRSEADVNLMKQSFRAAT